MDNSQKFLKILSGFIETGILTSQDIKKDVMTSIKFKKDPYTFLKLCYLVFYLCFLIMGILMEFKYLANEKLIKGKEIKFTNKIKDEFFLKMLLLISVIMKLQVEILLLIFIMQPLIILTMNQDLKAILLLVMKILQKFQREFSQLVKKEMVVRLGKYMLKK